LNPKISHRFFLFLVVLGVALATIGLQPIAVAGQSMVRTQNVQLYTGDSLLVQSDRPSIQRVFIQGNLSAANFTTPAGYPSANFQFRGYNASSFEIRLIFNYSSDYRVNLIATPANQTHHPPIQAPPAQAVNNDTSYYVSGGPFELDVNLVYVTRPNTQLATIPVISPWDSFAGWIGKFGEAFPMWVKALYLVLGIQFFAVGGIWITRESRRRETAGQRLDVGDKAYLWLDVLYKFLVVSFAAIVTIMGGELLLLFVLRFMFLASIHLLSLWDLFVVGFAVGVIIIVYLVRFTLEKACDRKPVEVD
jgi:hypothetical protein